MNPKLIAEDTIQLLDSHYSATIEDKFYDENDSGYKLISTSPPLTIQDYRFCMKTKIDVRKQTTLEAIIENAGKSFAVLNFASAKHPGGGFLNGAVAQEETLARSSTLYNSLMDNPEFYTPVKDSLYTDKIIYSKNIIFFKDDDGNRLEHDIYCDVITCAAPNYSGTSDRKFVDATERISHQALIQTRFEKILKVALLNNQRNLILGAWGCGVFKNPADINALAMYNVLRLYDGCFDCFDNVIFAIPAIPNADNFDVFINQFSK